MIPLIATISTLSLLGFYIGYGRWTSNYEFYIQNGKLDK